MSQGHVHRVIELMDYQIKDSRRRIESCLAIAKSAKFDPEKNSRAMICIADIVKNENLMRQHMASQEEYLSRSKAYLERCCSHDEAQTSIEAHPELKAMIEEFTKSSRKMVTLEAGIRDSERKRSRYSSEAAGGA